MYNTLLLVTIPNGIEDIPDQRCRIMFREMSFFTLRFGNNPIKQFSSGTQFRNQMQIALVFVHFFQLNNIGMIDFFEYFNFSFQYFNFRYFRFPNRFDRILRVGGAVHAFPDNTVMAVAEFLGLDMILDTDIGQGVRNHEWCCLRVRVSRGTREVRRKCVR